MNPFFQEFFVGPINKEQLEYTGSFKAQSWSDGILKSSDHEWKVVQGIPIFDSDYAGDPFSKDEIDRWYDEGIFQSNWTKKQRYVSEIGEEVARLGLPVLDIATGPGLGLLPSVLTKNPEIITLATDACSHIVTTWQRFMQSQSLDLDLSFAAFDARYMPLRNSCIDVITSFCGFSSVRYGGFLDSNRNIAVREAFRILKNNGHVFTIESRYADISALKAVFDKWGKEYWAFDEQPWGERFMEAGFTIRDENPFERRKLRRDDNDLGEAADNAEIDIFIEQKAFHLQKP
jgi:ubiquinone/menaquinone biosynthesis C-methylase UbiE